MRLRRIHDPSRRDLHLGPEDHAPLLPWEAERRPRIVWFPVTRARPLFLIGLVIGACLGGALGFIATIAAVWLVAEGLETVSLLAVAAAIVVAAEMVALLLRTGRVMIE